ncbi:MAG: DUF2807 domain-containing protein [Ignavibacteriae bacterium]|nr:DUF2807 domain-containing protein [Ignavibacteriota bacterium]
MKKLYFIYLAAFISIVFISCEKDIITNDCVKGSKNIIYDYRKLSSYNSIDFEGAGNIFITQGQSDTLIIETDDNIAPLIKTDVMNSRLYIKPSESICPTSLQILATMEDINYLNFSGSGSIISTDSLYLDDIDIKIEGSGKVRMFGKARSITAGIDGSGNLELIDMTTDSAYVVINGSGDISVHATKYLKAVINGSGHIYYSGNPITKETQINGSGNIINVP